MDWMEQTRNVVRQIQDDAEYTGEDLKTALFAILDIAEFEVESHARRYALLERARKAAAAVRKYAD